MMRAAQAVKVGPTADASENDWIQEYDARRCHICAAKYPPFGFGPILTRAGSTLWACHAHRAEVDTLLIKEANPQKATGNQTSLF